ncbi:RNA polymerase sigma factor SigJ [Dactylosporangium matsuzakiense]|uniref:RNA polymerase sigma factor n=1 Tax=Dactylosporangium matsuzakiense TaxID=53360 RepID=A0A9W6NNV7_9ACTN|nr:RNA polymerase sigma factor SigJ [Dactylosporangium matsuzakiense]GLL04405.1 RNA polymerase sigma factor [Dactylosporangium matsuzakiense]
MSAVMDERRQLLNVAYRLLGSLADAEDVVQEAFARWYALAPDKRRGIASPGAWLTTVTSRICLDLLGSARVRRERYVGEWIPEPLPGDTGGGAGADPADRVTLDESVNMAFLVVLENMTPAERVAFVLHDVFRYSFAEVAAVVGRSPGACRQLASSARRRIESARVERASAERKAGLVRQFARAWAARDIDALIGVLDPDAVAVSDGGGIVPALLEPVVGAAAIAQGLIRILTLGPELTVLERTVNGQPGLVAQVGGVTTTVMAFEAAGERITRIWAVRNPEKLRTWTNG